MGFGQGDQWKGNKNGRPKAKYSIAQYIRQNTKNGREIADGYLKLMRDPDTEPHIRLQAMQRLEERAYGRAPVTVLDLEGNATAVVGTVFHFPIQPGQQQQQIEQRNVIDITPPERTITDNSTVVNAATEQRHAESNNDKRSESE